MTHDQLVRKLAKMGAELRRRQAEQIEKIREEQAERDELERTWRARRDAEWAEESRRRRDEVRTSKKVLMWPNEEGMK